VILYTARNGDAHEHRFIPRTIYIICASYRLEILWKLGGTDRLGGVLVVDHRS